MKRLLTAALIGGALAFLLGGCGSDPCEELKKVACEKCGKDSTACKVADLAKSMGDEICKAALAEKDKAEFCK